MPDCTGSERLTAIFERFDERRERGRSLSSVGVVQVKALEIGAPLRQHFNESAVGQVRGRQFLRDVTQLTVNSLPSFSNSHA